MSCAKEAPEGFLRKENVGTRCGMLLQLAGRESSGCQEMVAIVPCVNGALDLSSSVCARAGAGHPAKLGGNAEVRVALSCRGRRAGAVRQRIAFHSGRRWVPSSSYSRSAAFVGFSENWV